MSFALALYRGVGRAAGPFVSHLLRRRIAQGKEDRERQGERLGHASLPRPAGKLVWVHAASIGESLSALPLIVAIRQEYGAHILMTTGTVTSATMIAKRAAETLHQYAPVDTPSAVSRFLDHWRPDAALWIESEIWPTLLSDTARTGVPTALVNGRISAQTAKNWARARGMARALIGSFDRLLVQSDDVRDRILALGASDEAIIVTGDLKASRPAERPDQGLLSEFQKALGDRPAWLAASTHPGEESAVAAVHKALSARAKNMVTILAPRHPDRASSIIEALSASGLEVKRRSVGDLPRGLYLADTLGELPLWYAASPIAFIGGGWGKLGGHNPLEAAQADTAILSGPKVANFKETYESLVRAGAARFVADASELTDAVLSLTDGDGRPSQQALRMAQAGSTAGAPDLEPLNRTLEALRPVLERVLR